MFSIRQHCIPSYNFIRRTEQAFISNGILFPKELSLLEEKTAQGVCNKAMRVSNSKEFGKLKSCSIRSGAISNYEFVPAKEKQNLISLLTDVKHLL